MITNPELVAQRARLQMPNPGKVGVIRGLFSENTISSLKAEISTRQIMNEVIRHGRNHALPISEAVLRLLGTGQPYFAEVVVKLAPLAQSGSKIWLPNVATYAIDPLQVSRADRGSGDTPSVTANVVLNGVTNYTFGGIEMLGSHLFGRPVNAMPGDVMIENNTSSELEKSELHSFSATGRRLVLQFLPEIEHQM